MFKTADEYKSYEAKLKEYCAKIKKNCYSCNTFDNTQRGKYKCALKRSCPGLDPFHKGV